MSWKATEVQMQPSHAAQTELVMCDEPIEKREGVKNRKSEEVIGIPCTSCPEYAVPSFAKPADLAEPVRAIVEQPLLAMSAHSSEIAISLEERSLWLPDLSYWLL
jgi:hypothetical protein